MLIGFLFPGAGMAEAAGAEEAAAICGDIEGPFALDESQGDWVSVYYDEKDNTFYAYANLGRVRSGCAAQCEQSDPAGYLLQKFDLYYIAYAHRFEIRLSPKFQDARLVVAYVTGERLGDFKEYRVTDGFEGSYADVADQPYVLYSLTVPDCTRNDMIVFDLFFGDDKPVTMTELAPYL